ncbi:MAG: hypothetical protein OTI37_03125, partial [Planctomycetota bacterium]|nr:hypothetical protein [Planctomycetota bacterium]
LVDFLADRMRVDVSRWNPSEMIEIEALSDEEAMQLENDGCAATIAIGLALGAANSNLYALEILTSDAKKKRAFAERGIFHILMGVAAVVYIALSLIVMGGLADDAEAVSRSMRQTLQKNERNHQQALDLIEKIEERGVIFSDLRNRQAIGDSAYNFMNYLENNLPSSLWVESMSIQLDDGKDWGREGERIPVLTVRGRAEEDVRGATADFSRFHQQFAAVIPGGESAVTPSQNPRGKSLEWSIKAHLLNSIEEATGTEDE